jgi:hypothetical protein
MMKKFASGAKTMRRHGVGKRDEIKVYQESLATKTSLWVEKGGGKSVGLWGITDMAP